MRSFFCVLLAAFWIGVTLPGCGPDTVLTEQNMVIYDTEVAEVTDTSALFAWRTTVAGTTRVDLALLKESATNDVDIESVSDELFVPLSRGGGVRVKDPRFESVTNTHFRNGPLTNEHSIRVEDLLPGRTYVATVGSNNGQGAQVWEFGFHLTFTTLAAPVPRGEELDEIRALGIDGSSENGA